MTDYPKMDPEIKARWVKALRSGEYVQTIGVLWRLVATRDAPAGNCCLGVLARVEGLKAYDLPTHTLRGVIYGHERATGILPRSYRDTINLHEDAQEDLAGRNDSGASFEKIADWIEQNL